MLNLRRYSAGLFLIQIFLVSASVVAQTHPAVVDQQLVVRMVAGEKPDPQPGVEVRPLIAALDVYLLTYSSETEREDGFAVLGRRSDVIAVERNHPVTFRATPDDERYAADQQNLVRSGFERAWDLTSGGLTTDGEEIVVAVLDAGFDVGHNDLRDNLWRNLADLPGDGLDNDGNGYVDDLFGWDMAGDDNALPTDAHGTQVIGLLGARGNNGRGIAGTNWRLKMMLFSIVTSANVVEAYGYILEQRQRYNSSEGREGALVVATNASFGVEGATCTDFPVWGGLYDELGRAGILTAASTANRGWDVDTFGDMPTDCPSEYLLGVANLGENDRLWRSSGWGIESVDLAAPGQGSYSTRPSGTYGPFGSTSAAAPYVAGAVALLYATPCPTLLETMRADPGAAALLVRDVLLAGTDANAALTFRTVSGGSLNVAEAQRLLLASCSVDVAEDFAITALFPNPATATVNLVTNAVIFSESARVELFDGLGRMVRLQTPERLPGSPVNLRINVANLPAGAYLLRLTERDRFAVSRVVVR